MNAAAKVVDAEPTTVTDLAVIPRETALSVLTDTERFDAFYAKVKAETDAFVPDITTDKGRKAVAAMAFKVTKTKTAIDAAGKQLTEEWRTQTAKVDASRKQIRDKLDALRDEVRKPLTDWEEAEERRIAECERQMRDLTFAAVVTLDDTSETVSARLEEVRGRNLDPTLFGIELELAEQRRDNAVAALSAAHTRLAQEEADRAELERLRREAEERRQREEQERAAAEAKRGKEAYARSLIDHIKGCGDGRIGPDPQPLILLIRELEEKVVIDDDTFGDLKDEAIQARHAALSKLRETAAQQERDAAERIAKEQADATERAANEAAAKAAQEAAEKAAEEQRRRDAEHEAQLSAERRRADEAERARQEQEAKARQDREAREAKEREDQAAREEREANIAHRSGIMRAAKEALIEHCTLEEDVARDVVRAITARLIPNVSISF